jgi:acyl dehydratase
MKKVLISLMLTAAMGMLASVSQANCTRSGTIPRIFVVSGGVTNIGVRANGADPIFYNFTTVNPVVINAALVAEASHVQVQVTGNAAACGVPVGNVSAGGTVLNILVAP